MQPRLTVGILVLQTEGLVSAIRYLGFLFQTTPAGIVAKPQEVAVFIGHLSRDADLVAVEVVDFLFAFAVFVGPVMYLRQGLVLHFAVGQLAVDQVAEVVVVIAVAVVGFQAVVGDGIEVV